MTGEEADGPVLAADAQEECRHEVQAGGRHPGHGQRSLGHDEEAGNHDRLNRFRLALGLLVP